MVGSTPIQLNKKSFEFKNESNELIVTLGVNDLEFNSQYRVIIKNIKDTSNNDMVSTCQWDFTTVDSTGKITKRITKGNTGLCGSKPIITVPDKPQQVQAFSINETTVLINWKAPLTGSTADYYQIERSTDNQVTFTLLNQNVTDLTFTDTEAVKSINHIYKITAGNKLVGFSDVTALSNTVIPKIGGLMIKPDQVIQSNSSAQTNLFGFKLTYSPDGTMLAISEPLGDSTTVTDVGTIQLFNKTATGWSYTTTLFSSSAPAKSTAFGFGMLAFSPDSTTLAVGQINVGTIQLYRKTAIGWRYTTTLSSNAPASNNAFGDNFVFSPDGTTLAVGEYNGETPTAVDAGTVQLFKKTDTGWSYLTTVISDLPGKIYAFGFRLAFSPDSSTLAVGEVNGGANGTGTVQLFNKTTTGWNYKATLITNAQPVVGSGVGNKFGIKIIFSPDNTTLAITETRGRTVSVRDTGSVLLYDNTLAGWSYTKTLTSNSPAENNSFGDNMVFSPDSTILAIGEYNGDPIAAVNAGTVQLFNKTDTGWGYTTTLISNVPATGNWFGRDLVFSPDGTMIAVGEYLGDPVNTLDTGNVQIFNKTAIGWKYTTSLISTTPTAKSEFGINLIFNPDSTSIAIGEARGDLTKIKDAGVVNIFNLLSLTK